MAKFSKNLQKKKPYLDDKESVYYKEYLACQVSQYAYTLIEKHLGKLRHPAEKDFIKHIIEHFEEELQPDSTRIEQISEQDLTNPES